MATGLQHLLDQAARIVDAARGTELQRAQRLGGRPDRRPQTIFRLTEVEVIHDGARRQ